MAIKINFDVSNIPENPTLILATRKGDKIGKINAQNIVIKDSMTNGAEITFSVNKYINNVIDNLWNNIKDYKLVYCKEADLWFQAKVDIDELSNAVKNVSCVQLAQAELSQIMLYNIEINTENDIARDDYVSPTILYNDSDHSVSLLHRIMEKVPHYQIVYVSPTITNIQRTFTFDDTSLYDAFQNIAEEIGCLFIFHSDTDSNGNIRRGISVYDLESYCSTCGNRGHFTNTCPKCNGTNILEGYGDDTTIFITADELGNDIKFTSDTDSQKNCFKLEAGDDLMTATIRNCNPNGTDYIWYIPDYIKEDMSTNLVSKLSDYDTLYDIYNTTYSMNINQTLLDKYNQLVTKYSTLRPDFTALVSPIIGYSNLMTAYYQTIDFAMYLQSEMLPTIAISQIDANTEITKLTASTLSPVAVTNINNISLATANNAVLSVAKCLINPNYQIKVSSSSLNNTTWTGVFYIENYSDENDNATSESITITINNDYTNYVNQKIQKVLSQSKQDKMDISGLFDKSLSNFTNELKKYNLDSLNIIHGICQSCIDVMIEQGIAVNQSWNGTNLYNNLYMNYYNKLSAINNEQAIRENEVNIIIGKYNNDKLINQGIQTILNKHRVTIQTALNFENYLGSDLWLEFCAYKRESKYSNSNYISDGLNNAELFEKALEFVEKAKKELYASAELQHSISASLVNLLVIPKFRILTQYFKVGNWLRILVDDNIYKLRLISYEIDYNNLENISVEFSDILSTADGYTDEQSLMQKMSSMATTYSCTQHQAEQGSKTHITVNDWVRKGLNVTNNKIIQGASNQTQTWDEHGMLFRQFNYEVDDYDDCQLKIINSTLAVTDDNWLTVKTAVGKYYYIDPTTNQVTYAFGTNAETIVGKMILGEQLGIYNSAGSLTFNHNGLNTTNGINTFNFNPNATNLLTISKTVNNTTESIFYVDNNGTLHIKGDGSALDITANSSITGLSSSLQATAEQIYATVSQAQSKYNTSGYTISLYGYGNPTSTAYPPADHNNEYYLNQSNGTLWLCNSRAWNQVTTLTLITDALSSEIQQTATSITSTVSTTYETKADATSKLNTAKGYTDTEVAEAKNYADSGISTARTALESQITQTADSITSTVASSQSKYNTSGYTISLYGYGNPTSTAYPPADHNNEYYLNQSNGTLWLCNSRAWNQVTTLTLITTNLQTQITQNDNNISLIANKNGSGTVLSLKSDAVKLAWNNVSENIQFETMNSRAGMSVYDDSSNLLMRFDSRGANYYLGTETIDSTTSARRLGYIGTGAFTNDSDMRGIVFRLNYVSNNNPTEGRYMSWGYQETDGGNYDLKMVYYANNYNTYAKGMHFVSDNVYFHTDTYFKDDMHLTTGCSLYINDYIRTYRMSDGTGGLYSSSKTVKIYSGDGVRLGYVTGTYNLSLQKYIDITSSGVDCHSKITMYGNIDMQNSYSVINESDERLKTNIKNTSVNALKTINQIELKEFDWIENNQHEKIGIIAQQLQTILPDLVFEDEGNTKLSIKLLKFIPYLIKAIQELSLEIGITNNSESKEYTNTISLKEKKKFLKTIRNQEDKNIETLETNSIKKERKRIEVKG